MPNITVVEHLLLHQRSMPTATGRFTSLLNELILAAKIISREVRKAGLVDALGMTGDVNVQGENVQKLDEFANRVLIHRLERAGVLCVMASEENADLIPIPACFPRGNYILVFDPLDGSSNIDVNASIGTIFSIRRRHGETLEQAATLSEVLRKGTEQVAAGYFLYGSSTMMVYTTGDGVHGFTLDPSVGEFLLSHPYISIPERGGYYSVNEANWFYWSEKVRRMVMRFKDPEHRPHACSLRYIGALVADFHRTLLSGGVFMYPADMKDSKKPFGKLRLMYEAAPLAMLAEHAGGMAIDGTRRIMEIEPELLHERVPFFVGSKADVMDVQRYLAD